MSINLSIVRTDDDEAKLIVTSTEAGEGDLEFAFETDLQLDQAQLDDIEFPGSVTSSSGSATSNGTLTATTSGRLEGPVEPGTEIVVFDFDLDDAGQITIASFTGTLNGVAFEQPELPVLENADPDPDDSDDTADLIDGTFEVGSDLTVDYTTLPDAEEDVADTASVQWLRDGVPIPDATLSTYTITDDDAGTQLGVRVTYIDDDGEEQIVTSSDSATVTEPGDPDGNITGTDQADLLIGTQEADQINGLAGDDTLDGQGGDDVLDGGPDSDTALFSGTQSGYTLAISPDGTILTDRRAEGDGQDSLVSIEALKFAGDEASFDLETFGGAGSLDDDTVEDIVELYVAYFNRAPDAVGLNFWGTAVANGTTIEEVAALFSEQEEANALYPDDQSTEDFIGAIYQYVLGRDPDAEGLTFWSEVLDSGAVEREAFVLEVVRGVDADVSDDASDEFIAQKEADEDYLDAKVDLAELYAVEKGLTDVDEAAAALAFFDGTEAGENEAIAAINGFETAALDPESGDFLMPLVGVQESDDAIV